MSSQLKDSTKRNHLTTISLLQSFKPTIEFEDLTYNFVTDFEKFLYESGYQTNTVAKHMKHLKSFVNAAINKGYIDPNNYAFRRYKIKMKEGKHVFYYRKKWKNWKKCLWQEEIVVWNILLMHFYFAAIRDCGILIFVNLNEKKYRKKWMENYG